MHPPFFKIMDEIQVLPGCTCLTATAENCYVDSFIEQSPVVCFLVCFLAYSVHTCIMLGSCIAAGVSF